MTGPNGRPLTDLPPHYLEHTMQLELDTATWDLTLDSSGNIAVLSSDWSALLAQRIKTRLQTFRGELYLDRSVGVPYFEEVLKKHPDIQRVRDLLLTQVATIPGVQKVISLELTMDDSTRTFFVNYEILSDGGEVVKGEL